MIRFAMVDEAGNVTRAGAGLALPDGAVELPMHLTPEAVVQMRLVDGEWDYRPVIPAPVQEGGTVTYAAPDGAVAEVCDGITGAILATVTASGGQIAIEFAPGAYLIEVQPPAPWMRRTDQVTVA
jgi:hypothetical protein